MLINTERARARYYCSESKSFKRHIPPARSKVNFDEKEPYIPDPPAKKIVMTKPQSIVGLAMETTETPESRPPKKNLGGNSSQLQFSDNQPTSPLIHHKKHVPAPMSSPERPSTPMRKQVYSPNKESCAFTTKCAEPIRHTRKYVPSPASSYRAADRASTPGRRHIRVEPSMQLTENSPVDPRHYNKRPASASASCSGSTIALSDANALAHSPIKSVSAHRDKKRSETPTKARAPVDIYAATSSIRNLFPDKELATASTSARSTSASRPIRKQVTEESLAAMFKPEPPPIRPARRPASASAVTSSSFNSFCLADIADACDNSLPSSTSKKMMANQHNSSSMAVTTTVFRLDMPPAAPEKPFVPAKRQVHF